MPAYQVEWKGLVLQFRAELYCGVPPMLWEQRFESPADLFTTMKNMKLCMLVEVQKLFTLKGQQTMQSWRILSGIRR